MHTIRRWILVAVVVIVAAGLFAFRLRTSSQTQVATEADSKNIQYVIDGTPVKLINGVASTEAAPGSASMITTKYFGNEIKVDLNGDGQEDVAFIITQTTGGSGTFYYAVAALSTTHGYVGSEAYLLGDRIAPQSTNISSSDPMVIVFNYADRAPGEPMTAQPSVGKSAFLKLDTTTLKFTEVSS